MLNRIVVIKGAGDVATGIAHRLFRSGIRLVMTELPYPTVIRRTVAFAQAVYTGHTIVEDVMAVKANIDDVGTLLMSGVIPVIIDDKAACVAALKPWAIVDAILAKKNINTKKSDAPVVVGVGPGFIAGHDVHVVIETMRGHNLGRVVLEGTALANTGMPGSINGYTHQRLLRAPCSGIFQGIGHIGEKVSAGEPVARVGGQQIVAPIDGVIRGLLQDGLVVAKDMKVGDIDPRGCKEYCFTISDKARAIGGGVLEALFMHCGINA